MAWFDAFERESWPGRSIRSGVLGCKILGGSLYDNPICPVTHNEDCLYTESAPLI